MRFRVTFLVIAMLFTFISSISCDASVVSLELSRTSYDYGTINLGDAKTYIFKVTNTSKNTVSIRKFAFLGVGALDYRITSGQRAPLIMTSGKALLIYIEFRPTLAGYRPATFSIMHSGSALYSRVNLIGNGLAIPRIQLTERDYNFGDVYVSHTATHDFEVSNIGTAELLLTQFSFSGVHASLYDVPAGANIPIRIAPSARHIFTVSFTPTAAGHFPIRLDISHNATNERTPIGISFTAGAVNYTANITLDKNSPWNFGPATSANPAIGNLKVSSTGVDPLTISNAYMMTSAEFTITGYKDKTNTPINLPHILNPNDYLFIVIEFNPQSTGNFNDKLSLEHDGVNQPQPLEIEVSGTGI